MKTVEILPDHYVKCSKTGNSVELELKFTMSKDNTIIVSIKENKKHITYSMSRVEEEALKELLEFR